MLNFLICERDISNCVATVFLEITDCTFHRNQKNNHSFLQKMDVFKTLMKNFFFISVKHVPACQFWTRKRIYRDKYFSNSIVFHIYVCRMISTSTSLAKIICSSYQTFSCSTKQRTMCKCCVDLLATMTENCTISQNILLVSQSE